MALLYIGREQLGKLAGAIEATAEGRALVGGVHSPIFLDTPISRSVGSPNRGAWVCINTTFFSEVTQEV